jgi:hypothetical protein
LKEKKKGENGTPSPKKGRKYSTLFTNYRNYQSDRFEIRHRGQIRIKRKLKLTICNVQAGPG